MSELKRLAKVKQVERVMNCPGNPAAGSYIVVTLDDGTMVTGNSDKEIILKIKAIKT